MSRTTRDPGYGWRGVRSDPKYTRDGRNNLTNDDNNVNFKVNANRTVRRANRRFCLFVLVDNYEDISAPVRKEGDKHKWY